MIERKIIIGLITSTEFIEKVSSIWNVQLLESGTAKRIAKWIWKYYEDYKKAPGKDIETIYFAELRNANVGTDLSEEMDGILLGLSEEYRSEGVNVDHLVQETRKYFSERHIKIHNDTVLSLLNTWKIKEAEDLILQYKEIDSSPTDLKKFIRSVSQIRERDLPPPITFLRPWLKGGQLTIIYGNFGSGKSLLTILVAYILGLKDFTSKEAEIGEWQVREPTGTLYIDGELGELEMEERIASFEWIGRQSGEHRIKVLSVPEYQLETEDSFFLSDRKNQMKILEWLKLNPTYRLIVLDSASTLFGLTDENDNSEWNNKINPFLRNLRALGVSCILLHHSGKDAKRGFRGASSMGAMAHNIFRLVSHPDKQIDNGEAWFIVSKDKQRASKKGFKTFALHMYQEDNDTHWELTDF